MIRRTSAGVRGAALALSLIITGASSVGTIPALAAEVPAAEAVSQEETGETALSSQDAVAPAGAQADVQPEGDSGEETEAGLSIHVSLDSDYDTNEKTAGEDNTAGAQSGTSVSIPASLATASSASNISIMGNRLTGVNKELYDGLKPKVTEVAEGTRIYTGFAFYYGLNFSTGSTSVTYKRTGTKDDELGLTSSSSDGDLLYALLNKLGIDYRKIVLSLLNDLPYEMYWFDKTAGFTVQLNGYQTKNPDSSNPSYVITQDTYVRFLFPVSTNNYRSTDINIDSDDKPYYANSALTGYAAGEALNALDVEDQTKSLSDTQTLTFFKDWLLDNVSYDSSVTDTTAYGDPWQIIYVFDGNDNTKVVCEGYAKAFKYLCDLHTFQDSSLSVGIVSGGISIDSGNYEAHMWNIVHRSDGNYLVDVTNSGDSNPGADGELFLQPVSSNISSGSGGISGCVTKAGDKRIVYQYDNDTLYLFRSSDLRLTTSKDSRGMTHVTGVDVTPALGTVMAGKTLKLSATVTPEDAENQELDWTSSDEKIATVAADGTVTGVSQGTATITATSTDSSDVKDTATITVTPASTNGQGNTNTNSTRNFTDVPSTSYAAKSVSWAAGTGITVGYGNGQFGVNDPVRRDQFVLFLYRLDKLMGGTSTQNTSTSGTSGRNTTSFTDIANEGQAFRDAIEWAARVGVVNGVGDNRFDPAGTVTREQAAQILYRYYNGSMPEKDAGFSDVADAWYTDAVNWCAQEGITSGVSKDKFGVGQPTTRGQAVTFLYRAEGGT